MAGYTYRISVRGWVMPSTSIRIPVCNDASSGFVSAQVAPDHGARAVDGGVARDWQCCRACSADSAYVWHGRAASPMHDRQRDHGIRGGDWRRVWRRPINAGDRWQGGGVKMAGGREEQQTSIQDRGRGVTACLPCLPPNHRHTTPKGCPSLGLGSARLGLPLVDVCPLDGKSPLALSRRPAALGQWMLRTRICASRVVLKTWAPRMGEMGERTVSGPRPRETAGCHPGTLSVSLPGLLGERGGENIQPPPCPPLQCLSTRLSCLWLIPRAESIREPTDSLDSFIPLPPPLGCPLFFHEDDDDEHNGTQEQQQAPDKERPFRGPSHLPPARPLAALLAWTHCRCHSATPSPTGRLFPSRVAGLYWQNEPSSYQRRHLPVALPSPTHTPLFKVQNPHCHPRRKLAHTPMQHASGEPRTKTTSRLPCQW